MRKFKRHQPRSLRFRLLLVAAGALLLMAAFAPRANAQGLIAYYNFEDGVAGTRPPDFTSEPFAFFGAGSPNGDRPITTDYGALSMANVTSTFTNNKFAGDPDPSLIGLGLSRAGANNGSVFNINLNTSQGFFSNMTVSFAVNSLGNGFSAATITFSTDGGVTFAPSVPQAIPSSGVNIISLALPSAANNTPLLIVQIALTGGTSNDPNPESVVDNITVSGTIVPEPATVAGGLLGVLGLCWFQRRRLIGSLRLRRA